MSAEGQATGGKAGSYQKPANKTFAHDPKIPSMDGVKLVNYDFKKYGSSAERRRIIEKWEKEVNSLSR